MLPFMCYTYLLGKIICSLYFNIYSIEAEFKPLQTDYTEELVSKASVRESALAREMKQKSRDSVTEREREAEKDELVTDHL